MRILLLHNALAPTPPPSATIFLKQLVRHAAEACHELHELVPNLTEAGNGADAFRSLIRHRLDAEVAAFDPQIVHVHGLGMLGHLTLETGVPYLISSFGDELSGSQNESALCNDSLQSLENAGRIVVDSQETHERMRAMFGDLENVVVLPAKLDLPFQWWEDHYREILTDRHGPGRSS